MSRWVLPIVALTLACERGSAEPTTAPLVATSSEPALAGSATPVFVTLGRDEWPSSRTSKPTRTVLYGRTWGGSDWALEPKPAGGEALVERLGLELGESAFVEPEVIAGWSISAPTGPIWLIGPGEPCAAEIGRPLVGLYSIQGPTEGEADPLAFADPDVILELAWELRGCEIADPEVWAPIGLQAERVDPTLRWKAATLGEGERFEPSAWRGPLADELHRLVDESKRFVPERPVEREPEWWLRRIEVSGTPLGEWAFSTIWRSPGSKDVDHCFDEELRAVVQVRTRGDELLAIGRELRGPLLGALVGDDSPPRMVWRDSLKLVVAEVGEDSLGEPIELETGVFEAGEDDERGYSRLADCD
ncbi:hypothetical protein ACNOYE_18570 [Nannocystaceae bacterium ST9]